MQRAKLTRRERVITALLFTPVGLATSGLLMWGMEDVNGPHGPVGIASDVGVGLAVSIWLYRNAGDDRDVRARRRIRSAGRGPAPDTASRTRPGASSPTSRPACRE